MKIAWIGTGVMGKPMALHLVDAGHEVNVYNRTFSKAKEMEPRVKAFDDIKSCVEDVDVVFSIVGYPKDVESVYAEIMKFAKAGTILVDMTTSSPDLAAALAQQATKHGLEMLDAPVTGGDIGAQNATLSIMVGGDEKTYEKILPLLESVGNKITYLGKAGSGQHAKLANQAAIAGALVGVAEALAYAKEHNLNLDAVMRVITGGSASSWQAENNGPKMIREDCEPGFYIKHFLKDLNLILAEKGDTPLPVVKQAADIYEKLNCDGLGDEGTQAVYKYYQPKQR